MANKWTAGCECCGGGGSGCPCNNNPASFTSVEIDIPGFTTPAPLLPCGGTMLTISDYPGATIVMDPADWFTNCNLPPDCVNNLNPYVDNELPGVTFTGGQSNNIGMFVEFTCSGVLVCTAAKIQQYIAGCPANFAAVRAGASINPSTIVGFPSAVNYRCPVVLVSITAWVGGGFSGLQYVDRYLWYKATGGSEPYDCTGTLAYYGSAHLTFDGSAWSFGPCSAFYSSLADVTVTAVP